MNEGTSEDTLQPKPDGTIKTQDSLKGGGTIRSTEDQARADNEDALLRSLAASDARRREERVGNLKSLKKALDSQEPPLLNKLPGDKKASE